MRQGQQNRRGRGRGRKAQNPLSRNLESNGPDVKIRGTASHIAEKYAALARDAMAAGDSVAGESYLQHAEHYNRIIMASQPQQGDGVNGSGRGRRDEIADVDEEPGDTQPEMAADAHTQEAAAPENGTDDGVLRTIARSAKHSGNGADADHDGADDDADEAPAKKGRVKDTPPGEAVT